MDEFIAATVVPAALIGYALISFATMAALAYLISVTATWMVNRIATTALQVRFAKWYYGERRKTPNDPRQPPGGAQT